MLNKVQYPSDKRDITSVENKITLFLFTHNYLDMRQQSGDARLQFIMEGDIYLNSRIKKQTLTGTN